MIKLTILQLKDTKENHGYFYSSLRFLKKFGLKVELDRYRVVYTDELDVQDFEGNKMSILDQLFTTFNLNHPKDFRGHSLSVSDIVKLNDEYFFCDDFGWKKLEF